MVFLLAEERDQRSSIAPFRPCHFSLTRQTLLVSANVFAHCTPKRLHSCLTALQR